MERIRNSPTGNQRTTQTSYPRGRRLVSSPFLSFSQASSTDKTVEGGTPQYHVRSSVVFPYQEQSSGRGVSEEIDIQVPDTGGVGGSQDYP